MILARDEFHAALLLGSAKRTLAREEPHARDMPHVGVLLGSPSMPYTQTIICISHAIIGRSPTPAMCLLITADRPEYLKAICGIRSIAQCVYQRQTIYSTGLKHRRTGMHCLSTDP